MLSLFIGCFFPIETDFGITFAVCNPCHCKVHTDFGAFACEICTQIRHNILGCALCNADDMLCRPAHCFGLLNELFCGCTANGTYFGSGIALMNVTAY